MPEDEGLEALPSDGQSEVAVDTRPEWLPDNFRSPEAFRDSYDEQRSTIQRLSEERARQEELINEMAMRMEAPASTSAPQNELIDRYEQALAEGDGATILALNAFVAEQAAQKVAQEVAKAQSPRGDASDNMFARMVEQEAISMYEGSQEDWLEVRPQVERMLDERPNLIRDTADPTLAAMDLLDVVRIAESRRGTVREPRDNAAIGGLEGALRESGLPADQQKRLAQTLAGAGVRAESPDDSDDAYAERIRTAKPLQWQG